MRKIKQDVGAFGDAFEVVFFAAAAFVVVFFAVIEALSSR